MIYGDVRISDPATEMHDQFALQAMAALIPLGVGRIDDSQISPDEIAEASYKIADAMMARRQAGRMKAAAKK